MPVQKLKRLFQEISPSKAQLLHGAVDGTSEASGSAALVPASSLSSPPLIKKWGITVLHDEPNAILDVVFVHGLNGHPDFTWRHGRRENGVHWPSQLLKEDLPNTRIITYGYDATTHSFMKPIAQARLDNYACEMLGQLACERKQEDAANRKICFVAHSLGGLIVASALAQTPVEDRLKKIQQHVTGILLLGVPLRGSDSALMGTYLRKLIKLCGWKTGSEDILRDLSPCSKEFTDVRKRFVRRLKAREHGETEIHITCFYEQIEVKGMGLIVSEDSATFDHYDSYPIHANHMDMPKFLDRADSGYKHIVRELENRMDKLTSYNVERNKAIQNSTASLINYSGNFRKERNQSFAHNTRHMAIDETENYAKHPNIPTPRCIGLPKNDDDFIVRDKYLRDIGEKFRANKFAVALVGLAGIGKSRLAIKFGHDFYTESPTPWVFWVQAGSKAQLKRGYKDIADTLGIPCPPNVNILERVHDHMRNKIEERWLLIVDNVDDLSILFKEDSECLNSESLKEYLPYSQNGSILITSCSKKLENSLVKSGQVITVMAMTESEAIYLLEKESQDRRTYSYEDKIRLSEALDRIPLAIVQATGFLNQQKFYPLKEYLVKLQATGTPAWVKHLDRVGRPNEGYETKEPIVKTLHIEFEHILKTHEGAANLMSQMSFCDRQSIPGIIFKDEPNFEEDVRELIDHSLIDEKEEETYVMHSLVQGAIRAWLAEREESEKQTNSLISKLYKKFPAKDFDCNNRLSRALFQHVQELFSIEQEIGLNANDWNNLLYRVTCFLEFSGEFIAGLKFVKKMLERLGKTDQRGKLTRTGLCIQGRLLGGSGEPMEAETSLLQVKEMSEDNIRDKLDALTDLMTLYTESENTANVSNLQEQVKKMRYGNDMVEIRIKNILAVSYQYQDQWEEAGKKWRRIVDLAKGIEDNGERRHWYNLACLSLVSDYFEQKKYADAKDFLKRELEEEIFGENDEVTHGLRIKLANAQYCLEEYSSAKNTLMQSRNSRDWNRQDNHLFRRYEFLLILINHSNKDLTDTEFVDKLLEEETCHFNLLGENHRFTLIVTHFTAIKMKEVGRRDDAIVKMKDCYERRKGALGSANFNTQESLSLWTEWEKEREADS